MRPRAATSLCAALLTGSVLVAGCGGAGGGSDQETSSSGSPDEKSSAGSAPTAAPEPASTRASILNVLDAPVGQAADRKGASTPVQALFSPPAAGTPVAIQEKVGGSWKDVATGQQDKRGRFLGQVPAGADGSVQRLRASTSPEDGSAAVTSKPVRHQNPKLVWSDEFSGDALDPAKWRTREQPAFGGRMCAQPDASRVSVKGGSAVLTVKRVRTTAQCPDGFWHNAMIGTGEVTVPGFQTTYGVFAARVKFQPAQGMHGSFWMQSSEPGGAEIDVAEYFGDGRNDGGLSNFVHATGSDGAVASAGGTQPSVARVLGGKSPAADWHVFSVDWSPEGYVFRLDGKQTFRTDKPVVSSAREFLVLSLLTSDYEIPRIKDPSSTMKVDWVRVWQK